MSEAQPNKGSQEKPKGMGAKDPYVLGLSPEERKSVVYGEEMMKDPDKIIEDAKNLQEAVQKSESLTDDAKGKLLEQQAERIEKVEIKIAEAEIKKGKTIH